MALKLSNIAEEKFFRTFYIIGGKETLITRTFIRPRREARNKKRKIAALVSKWYEKGKLICSEIGLIVNGCNLTSFCVAKQNLQKF